eukprot:CAMPEP_0194432002 /NCGR_PEP_ID=MMETSP0176-20130528/67664_1 /TAXON_ID=216777 /ORGANISM="Proboscia alata, Strain PI-D3" /LENGTH=322 /DNA_ID=CAMNT_0039247897 /DNA_START=17 /DNA_END=985 /DNA_ORIENTATION=+
MLRFHRFQQFLEVVFIISTIISLSLITSSSAFNYKPLPTNIRRSSHTFPLMAERENTELPRGLDENISPRKIEKALFGMGCFWRPQSEFQGIIGVQSATCGYARANTSDVSMENDDNNSNKNTELSDRKQPASYFSVCQGDGRSEAILVEYDPSIVSYGELLQTFWQQHDASEVYPTQKADQYRSVIWPLNEKQRATALEDYQNASEAYEEGGMDKPNTIISSVAPIKTVVDENMWLASEFTKAESIHQRFWLKLKVKLLFLVWLKYVSEDGALLSNSDLALKISFAIAAGWVLFEGAELALNARESLGLRLAALLGEKEFA